MNSCLSSSEIIQENGPFFHMFRRKRLHYKALQPEAEKIQSKTIKETQCFQPTKGKKQGNNCPNCAKKA